MSAQHSTHTSMNTGPEPFPVKARVLLATLFTGGGLVVCGALLAWLFVETTPIHVLQVHKSAIQTVAKSPSPVARSLD